MMTNNFKIILAGILVFQIVFFVIGGMIIRNLDSGKDVTSISARKEDLQADQQKLVAIVTDLNKTLELETAKLNSMRAIANKSSSSNSLLLQQELLAKRAKEAAASPPSLPVAPAVSPSSPSSSGSGGSVVTRAS